MKNGADFKAVGRVVALAVWGLYGLYCIVVQTAWAPASYRDDYLYSRMEGRYAVAFGFAVILFPVCFPTTMKKWREAGGKPAMLFVRYGGFATAVGLFWYAMAGATEVDW